jgi:hypothetical protein
MDRFTIKSFRNSVNGKAYTVILGSAWTDKNGRLQLAFDALPLPDDKGAVRAFLKPLTSRTPVARRHREPATWTTMCHFEPRPSHSRHARRSR